jgi:hypothetical protein
VRRRAAGRSVEITPLGWRGLAERLGITVEAIRPPAG